MATERCAHCGGRFDRPGLFGGCAAGGHPAPTPAQRIAAAIEADIIDRRGLGGEWESIDPDMQDEIRDEWARVIDDLLPRGPVR